MYEYEYKYKYVWVCIGMYEYVWVSMCMLFQDLLGVCSRTGRVCLMFTFGSIALDSNVVGLLERSFLVPQPNVWMCRKGMVIPSSY